MTNRTNWWMRFMYRIRTWFRKPDQVPTIEVPIVPKLAEDFFDNKTLQVEPPTVPELIIPEPEPEPFEEPEPFVEDKVELPTDPTPEPEEFKQKRTVPWAGKERGPYEMAALRKAIAIETDLILYRFESLARRGMPDTAWKHAQLDLVQEVLGNDFMLFNDELKEKMRGGDKYSKIDNVNQEEMVKAIWPIDFGFCGYYTADDEDDEEGWREVGGVLMQWVHSVDPAKYRGRIRIVPPRIVEVLDATFGDNDRWRVVEHVYGLVNNKWVQLDTNLQRLRDVSPTKGAYIARKRHHQHEWINKVITTAMAEQLEARYQWHVAFGAYEGGPRILLPTNPTGALKLFRNRQANAETNRREALKHWVEKHLRDTEEYGTSFVRDHLRGQTQFSWQGYDCELMVSQYDLEKNELFRQEAEQWRATRGHNRFKVKMRKGR